MRHSIGLFWATSTLGAVGLGVIKLIVYIGERIT